MGWLRDTWDVPIPIGIAIALLAGTACGLANGLLVTKAKLPAFIATLTMMSVGRGLANIVTDGRQVVGFPDWFTALASVRNFGFLSVTVGLFIALVIVSWVFLNYHAVGRSLYAIGGGAEVARLAGIHVQRLTLWVYALAGLLSGVAGIAMASRLDSSEPSAGLGYELDTRIDTNGRELG